MPQRQPKLDMHQPAPMDSTPRRLLGQQLDSHVERRRVFALVHHAVHTNSVARYAT